MLMTERRQFFQLSPNFDDKNFKKNNFDQKKNKKK
jgi:hypothetical protein